MKRILAVFLTLAMALNIAPMAAFAAADSDAASIVAIEETDENASSQLDEQTARAIASDPFLQAAYAQTEQEQTGQAEVDTSNMSVSATNSFGQLLVNGMEGQSTDADGSTNRITNVTMNGRTANVKFVLDGTADLMVAIYTDSTEEEMVASGTTEVSGSADNGAAQVSIVGDIPETYTIKAFLLDKTDHSPLSSAYTDVSHTQVMVDLDKATVDDFEEDRTINLDTDKNTNFAVVKQDVTLVKQEDAAGKNTLLEQDDDGLNYTIANASEEIKNLQVGDILTYEYAEGELLVVRVESITKEGDTVKIHGDDTLELTDVFDALKIETESQTSDLTFEQKEGFEDLGNVQLDPTLFAGDSDLSLQNELDETNASGETNIMVGRKWSFSKQVSGSSGSVTASATVGGNITISANADFNFYVTNERQSLKFTMEPQVLAELTITGRVENDPISLPGFSVMPVLGVTIGCDPELNLRAEVELTATAIASTTIGFAYEGTNIKNGKFTNLSEAPTFKVEGSVKGTLYVGVNFKPNVKVAGGVAELTIGAEIGATAAFTLRAGASIGGTKDHECAVCYNIDLTVSISVDAEVRFIIWKTDPYQIIQQTTPLGEYYWSSDYKEFGKGDCPHTGSGKPDTPDKPDAPDAPTNPDIPTGGTVVASGSCGADGADLTWTLDDNGLLTISGTGAIVSNSYGDDNYVPWANYRGSIKYVWIKNGVTGIGAIAFKGTGNLTIVEIPDSVTSIYKYAFEHCTNLQELTLPESVTRIDQYAFADCTSLRKITVPKNVKSLGWNLFEGCTGLVSAEIMDGVPAIGDRMFRNCTNLRSVTIPESAANIGESAFENCAGLLNVVIPKSVGSISGSAFKGCSNLRSVTIPESVANIGESAFENCAGLSSVVLQKGVRNIGNYAFRGCTNLAKLTLPDGLSSIGAEAFANCTSLRKVTLPESVINVGAKAFYNCSSLSSVTIPEGVLQIEREAFEKCGNLAAVAVPGTVSAIGEGAFRSCAGLKKAEIADGVLSIGKEAFANCTSLTDLVLPESITSIGDGVFRGCTSLTRMTIPESLSNIGANVFNGCGNLSEVTILDGATSIGDGAFADCSNLTHVVIPESVLSIGYNAFGGCTSLAELDFPDSLQGIGGRAFIGCTSLTAISVPDSVTSIGSEAFRGCRSLTSATLPAGLTRISENAFMECAGLTNITVPANVTAVDSGAFGACSGLTKISLPNGLTTIGRDAFSGCINLKEISIPESVTEIGGSAFKECYSLKNIEIPGKVTAINYDTFRGCRNLESVGIPQSILSIGTYVFDGCGSLKDVNYSGTKKEWNVITIWFGNDSLTAATIHCTDGDIIPNTENSITTGTASTSDGKFQATFANAKAGKEYVVLVSRAKYNSLSADNLIYINQITADADGELAVPFRTAADAAEMTYVVACAQDDATVEPGKPDQPGGDEPSSGGDDGGGAIILIGGVAAVAAVAGVVLMMPVKVEGTVKLADQPVANASVQVLQGNAVKAETVTDANGHFAVKVKRGGYTLRVQWTDVSGQPVTRTVDFKAPDANLNVAA